jgi:manganese/iron transport system permease protein
MSWLLDPLGYPFMVRALVAAVLVGGVCALVGSYVVVRGMAFLGDALAHAVLPGVAIGYVLGGGARAPVFWSALVTAVVTAIGMGVVSKTARLREDTAIGIVFAGMFAAGIALIATTRSYAVDLAHFLFGNVLGVTAGDLILTVVFAGLVILVIVAFFKEFLLTAFDPVLAVTLRLPVDLLNHILFVLIAITTVVSLQTVGVAMMVAMLVTPAATAYLLTRRLATMMVLGAILGAGASVIGLYLSYYAGLPSGAAIVLVTTGFFLVALLVSPRRSRLWGRQREQPV